MTTLIRHPKKLALVVVLVALIVNQGPTHARVLTQAEVIRRTATAPMLDGNCTDYDPSSVLPMLDDKERKVADVFWVHNADMLFVCVRAMPGLLYERWIAVYLDPDGDADTHRYAQSDDWRLNAPFIDGSPWNDVGDGTGKYVKVSSRSYWQAKTSINAQAESAEFAISLQPLRLGECGKLFGIAVAYHWVRAAGEDYFVPNATVYNQPNTWMPVTLERAFCPADLVHKQYVPLFAWPSAKPNSTPQP